jgi:hypothetical protein
LPVARNPEPPVPALSLICAALPCVSMVATIVLSARTDPDMPVKDP